MNSLSFFLFVEEDWNNLYCHVETIQKRNVTWFSSIKEISATPMAQLDEEAWPQQKHPDWISETKKFFNFPMNLALDGSPLIVTFKILEYTGCHSMGAYRGLHIQFQYLLLPLEMLKIQYKQWNTKLKFRKVKIHEKFITHSN